MSTTYFLAFLIGLVALFASITAEHNGDATLDEPGRMSFMSRFHPRGWARIKNHPSKSTKRSHERATEDGVMHLKTSEARRTMQKVEERAHGLKPAAMQNVQEIRRDKPVGCSPRAKSKDANDRIRALPENRPESFLVQGGKKITVHKLEDAPKLKRVGYKAETINIHKVKDMHQ